MKKFILIVLSTLILNSSPSYSVEFGQDATGDPNAVKVGGASGFLYSDRIIFTAAHVIESTGGLNYWEKNGVIYSPGTVGGASQRAYKVKKVIMSPTYIARSLSDQTRVDDFAIIILQESIPMHNNVVVATKEDIDFFILNKTTVHMVGYGLQNPSQREINKVFDLNPRKLTTRIIGEKEILQYRSNNLQSISLNQTILKYGIINTKDGGSICDGDSGAGFFVEVENSRFYIGPVGGFTWAIPNCYNKETFGIGGGISGITPTFKFMNLIKEAELIVSEDKIKEFLEIEENKKAEATRIKAEAEAKANEKSRLEAEEKARIELELANILKNNQDLARKTYSGKPCIKLRSTKTIHNIKFTCIKKGKKLVWNNGI
jgi:DNA-binding transcriptional MerR regulator